MEQNYSQKTARIFEIIGFVMLLPALFGMYAATFVAMKVKIFWLIWIVFFVGVALLVGYFKHSRGKLNERLIPDLWICTALYNAALMLVPLYLLMPYLIGFFRTPTGHFAWDNLRSWVGIGGIVVGYATLVYISVKALKFHYRERQKNR